jgi:hypothetical protein
MLRAVILSGVLGIGIARAQPILDVGAVPYLNAHGRASYSSFLLMDTPRAAAISSTGAIGWYAGGGTVDYARRQALARCSSRGATDCTIYADDLQVVSRPAQLPAVPGPLLQTARFAFVPDDRFIWHGPATAAGILVWGHGYSGVDYRGLQPPPLTRAFNNAGFDIVRFDRDPSTDYADWARDWLRGGLREMRRYGYRFVVTGGQSRGANDALFALTEPGLADGVIAVSPGGYGSFAPELARSVYQASSPAARVVFVQFDHDGIGGPDLPGRAEMMRTTLASRVGAVLVLDRPEGFEGHFAGTTGKFAVQFGPCIYRFITRGTGCGPAAGQVSAR